MFTKTLSNIISGILHPFLMPTLVYYLVIGVYFKNLFQFHDYGLLYFLGMILLSTCLLPSATIYTMFKFGIISDYNLIDRKDRLYPNFATIIIYAATYIMLKYVNHLNGIIVLPLYFMTITLLIHAIVSFYWKISAHATAAAGALGFWAVAQFFTQAEGMFYPLMIFMILVFGLMSSRLYLGRHTPSQVWAGATLGFVVAAVGVLGYFLGA